MTNFIKVTNHNNFPITDYFEGLAYKFAPDEPVNVPLDAMRHIFGIEFPLDEQVLKTAGFRDMLFNSCCKRFGWNAHNQEDLAKFKKNCNNISFALIETKVVEIAPTSDEIPSPREQKEFGKTKSTKFKPRADEEPAQEEEVA